VKGGAPGRFKEPPLSPPVRRPKNAGRARTLVSKVIRARHEGLPSDLEDRRLRGDGLGRSSIVEVYALTSAQRETLDLFLERAAAEAELRESLEDEPEWKDILRVVPIELDGRQKSAN
jgi:hypothetical protein